MRMFLKVLLICLGGGLILDTIILAFFSSFHIGKLLSVALGLTLLLYGIFFQQINEIMSHGILLWLRYLIYLFFAFMMAVMVFLGVYGQHDNVTYEEDAVIVLGAGLRGDRVSLTLAQRLDAAIDYFEKNPKALIVASGGQGSDEPLPEAEAMKQYLLDRGIPEEQIIMESNSSSTRENFHFSDTLLQKRVGNHYTAVYVTNGFHVYRAGKIADEAGIEANHYHGTLSWYMIPSCYLREFCAICNYWAGSILN